METFHISPESFNPDLIDFEPSMPLDNVERRITETGNDGIDDAGIQSTPTRSKSRSAETTSATSPRATRQRRKSPTGRSGIKTTSTAKPSAGSLKRVLADPRTRIFAGIVLGLCTVYLLVIAISYFTSIFHDQSLTSNNSLSELTHKSDKVFNIGGPLGAWLGEWLINRWLGVGAFILIFYMGAVTLMLLMVKKIKFWSLTFRCLLSIIAVSIVVGLTTWELESAVMLGGAHGHYFNKMLIEIAGLPGAIIASAIMVSLVVLVFFNDLRRGYAVVAHQMAERRRLQAERRAVEAEERRMREEEERRAIEADEKMRRIQEQRLAAENMKQPAKESIRTHGPVSMVEPPVEDTITGTDGQADTVMNETAGPYEIATLGSVGEMVIEAGVIEQADENSAMDAGDVSSMPVPGERGIGEAYDPRADLSCYKFPTLDILHEIEVKTGSVDTVEQEENKQRITDTLLHYGIPISSIRATVGPTVTLYEIVPAEGVRIAKIKRLEDDIALSLAALGIRIIAPIPGKGTIGIEVPNKEPQIVAIRQILGSKAYQECHMELPMAVGSTISNEVFIADLAKMPHLLVAGATGMGKSVGLNAIVASLLYKKHPAELKFVFVDPKMVEFSPYARLERHYLAKLPGDDSPIITDPGKVVATLNSLCLEMDNRYALLMDASCRNLKEYNAKFTSRRLNPEKGHRFLPYIVVIVDEFGDLILTAGKEVETPISRIAAKARAVGIHMILATQRPSTNVITGVIKANFPGRIAFRVFQMVDSRTILDRPGANQLIGRGDMLFSNNGKIDRVQCAFIDTDEVEAICGCVHAQTGYTHPYELPEYIPDDTDASAMGNLNDRDTLFEEAARFVVQSSTASTSSLQRRYSIGYNRAGKIMDQLEAAGIVGPSLGGKPRNVLIDTMQLERMLEVAV